MKNYIKSEDAYKTIGEVAKIVGLINKKKGTLSTHTIRFWEKEFKQIKPKLFSGNRRYYDKKTIDLLKKIKFLLKDKGLTIKGVKKILNNPESSKLDDNINFGVYKPVNKSTKIIKDKLKNISKIIKELKDIKDG